MFRDLYEFIRDIVKNVVTSRLFALAAVFTIMFGLLIARLFQIQIVEGEKYQKEYIVKTERNVKIASTRGNIYDRNGALLAYNELAYSVTVRDTGAYTKSAAKNRMLLDLVRILDKHGESVMQDFKVVIDSNGEMVFSTTSEKTKKRFLSDFYGLASDKDLDDEAGKYPSSISAREVFEKKRVSYGLKAMEEDTKDPLVISEEEALKVISIRYAMSFTDFKKYETTTVSTNISKETVADIMEHSAELSGVNIEEDTIRVYNDSVYFAPIIGYIGKASKDDLETLKKSNDNYRLNDMVGQAGIEEDKELELQGVKGSQTMFVDSVGRILEITDSKDPTAGNDLYLSIDRKLQIGIYNLIEQQLAGVLADKIVNYDVIIDEKTDMSEVNIPVKDAYYQLVNNNVLSIKSFADPDASPVEQQIHSKFTGEQASVLDRIREQLSGPVSSPMNALPEDMNTYMKYIYKFLSDKEVGIIVTGNIDTNDEVYKNWVAGNKSLREFIYYGISNNWVDTTKLNVDSKYSNADDIFQELVNYIISSLEGDTKFSKKIFRYLVNKEVVTGRELCLALYDQGVLPYDEAEVSKLTKNGNNYVFSFIVNKISNREITPAQLALDPSTGGCTVTDIRTGEVLAMVTYPSYDNNKLSGTVDGAYYNKLLDDMSLPLYSNATQTRTAPGSTFKPISAIAGLEEGVVTLSEIIVDTGSFDLITPPVRCWNRYGHGPLNLVGGIKNSCNYYFCDIGYRLSLDDAGNYTPELGISKLREYSTMFGLDRLSGVEVTEKEPLMTTEKPVPSAIGQGTNSYTNVQISRYITALANRGTVYDLSLLDKLTDSEGNLIIDYTPNVSGQVELPKTTWDAVQTGMRDVIASGSARDIFRDLEVDIAGKTGTAQEKETRANHALFVSYAPYNAPEISVTVNIPFGYTSANTATVAKNVYRLYYGYTDLETIVNKGAMEVSDVKIGD